eukprot:5902241-Ditylum_brightwellii.AAC.1
MSKKLFSKLRGSNKESKRDGKNGLHDASSISAGNVSLTEKTDHSESEDLQISPSFNRPDEPSLSSESQKQPTSILRRNVPSMPVAPGLLNSHDNHFMPDF